MTKRNQAPVERKYPEDPLFWYWGGNREVQWGFRAADQHEGRGYANEEEAYQKFRAYVRSHPELSKQSCALKKGSTIGVAFDGTIYPGQPGDSFADMKPPRMECVRTLQQLHNAGYKIVIWSVRANLAEQRDNMRAQVMVENMERYLRQHGIKYDEIHLTKPVFAAVLDDCAINTTASRRSWVQVREVLQMPPLPADLHKQEDINAGSNAYGAVPQPRRG